MNDDLGRSFLFLAWLDLCVVWWKFSCFSIGQIVVGGKGASNCHGVKGTPLNWWLRK